MATSAHRFPPSRHAHNKGGEEPMFGYKSGAFICGSGYHDLFTPCSNRTKTATTASAEICQGEMPTGNHVGWVFLRHRDVDGAAGHDWTPRRHVATRALCHQLTRGYVSTVYCTESHMLCASFVHETDCYVWAELLLIILRRKPPFLLSMYCEEVSSLWVYVGWVWIIQVIEVPT